MVNGFDCVLVLYIAFSSFSIFISDRFSDAMVFIKPDIEAGTIQDQADLVTQARYPEPDTDEEPDVEEIEVIRQIFCTPREYLISTNINLDLFQR